MEKDKVIETAKEELTDREKLYILPEKTGALYAIKTHPGSTEEIVEFKLKEKIKITHDTFIFTFELPEDLYLGLNLGHHVAINEFPEGEKVKRKYTPISHVFTKGRFDILIKIYYKDSHPNFPDGGKLTQWLDLLELGTMVKMRGPIGRLYYYGDGRFKYAEKAKFLVFKDRRFNKVGMLCGGTGITPLYQILQAAEINKENIEYSLVFGNRSSKDILLKAEIDTMSNSSNIKLNVNYTIDKPEEGWNSLVGYIDKDKIIQYMPPPTDDTLIMVCGRSKMCKKYLLPILLDLGYARDNIYIF